MLGLHSSLCHPQFPSFVHLRLNRFLKASGGGGGDGDGGGKEEEEGGRGGTPEAFETFA